MAALAVPVGGKRSGHREQQGKTRRNKGSGRSGATGRSWPDGGGSDRWRGELVGRWRASSLGGSAGSLAGVAGVLERSSGEGGARRKGLEARRSS